MSKNVLAMDFGASSGRGFLASFDGKKLTTKEIHRFENNPVFLHKTEHWDVLRLFYETKKAIKKAKKAANSLDSIGIDTWGVDYGILNEKDELIKNPVHYRDARTAEMMPLAYSIVPKEDIYKTTGIAFMPFNTLFQLLSVVQNDKEDLDGKNNLLLMPDLLGFFLSGVKECEYTILSTTQLLDANKKDYAHDLLNKMGIGTEVFTKIAKPGTKKGMLTKELSEEFSLPNTQITNVGSHDTASAVCAACFLDDETFYISSGTWSLIGAETSAPIINDKTYKYNYTNEGGVFDTIRLLKNIMGLWILQECKRQWDSEGETLSYAELADLASAATPFKAYINPAEYLFFSPGNMVQKINSFLSATGQEELTEKAEIVRCILESLAFDYKRSAEQLEDITGKKYKNINIIGGGSQNLLLNQLTANACQKTVIAGPVEATVIGNIMMQFYALGEVNSIEQIRKVIKDSIDYKVYKPENADIYLSEFEKFNEITKKYEEQK